MNRRRFATVVMGAALLACNKPATVTPETPETPQTPEASTDGDPEAEGTEQAASTTVGDKTIFVLRHAEKQVIEGERDPDLSEAGAARAEALVAAIGAAKIDAIYSSPYKRTTQTVTPLSKFTGVEITNYKPGDATGFAAVLLASDASGIVVAGHSNTVPPLVGALGVETEPLAEDQYGELYIITISDGKASLELSRFGQ